MGIFEFNAGNTPCDILASHPGRGAGGVQILLVASCCRNRDNHGPNWLLCRLDLTFLPLCQTSLRVKP